MGGAVAIPGGGRMGLFCGCLGGCLILAGGGLAPAGPPPTVSSAAAGPAAEPPLDSLSRMAARLVWKLVLGLEVPDAAGEGLGARGGAG